jgi:hypothetical protein
MTDTSDKAVQEAFLTLTHTVVRHEQRYAPHESSHALATLRARIDFDAFALQDAIAHANDFADEAGAAEARLAELEAALPSPRHRARIAFLGDHMKLIGDRLKKGAAGPTGKKHAERREDPGHPHAVL